MSQHSARGAAWNAQRLRVLNRDNWTCAYCHVHLEGDNATVDHVEAVALNPNKTYRDDELVAACRPCNGRKSDKTAVRLDYRNSAWL